MLSKRVKPPQINLKARRGTAPIIEPKISISLRYLTKNKTFNFDFFGKNFRDKAKIFEQCVQFLKRLTSKTMLELSGLRKFNDCGFETILFSEIKFSPDESTLSDDTKIHVFRFGDNDKCRMLGFFEGGQAELNIIGFDFNYSAYRH